MSEIMFYYPGCTGVANIINDDTVSSSTTWSSEKISEELQNATCCIDDNNVSNEKTWSSEKIVEYISYLDCGTF